MPTIAPFPHRYTVQLTDDLLTGRATTRLRGGAPPQFGGTEDVWSPEELLVAAALLCLKTTFDAYARRDGLKVLHWDGTGAGVLDRSPSGPVFTAIQLEVRLEVPAGREAAARQVLETAERHCIISRALQAPVVLSAVVNAAPLAERLKPYGFYEGMPTRRS